MVELKLIGGTRIGKANVSCPFATLTIEDDILSINASIIGSCYFTRQDIISLEAYDGAFSKGIKINHNIKTYSEKIIFWTNENVEEKIKLIYESIFFKNNNTEAKTKITEKQHQGMSPLKFNANLFVVTIIFLLFLNDFIRNVYSVLKTGDIPGSPIGITSKIAWVFILFFCLLLIFSIKFRQVFFKKNREADLQKGFLIVIIFLSLFILVLSFYLGNR